MDTGISRDRHEDGEGDLPDSTQPFVPMVPPAEQESEAENRRDRLLAGLTLMIGIGLVLAIPFALLGSVSFHPSIPRAVTRYRPPRM